MISLLIAVLAPSSWMAVAGLVYVITGPVMAINGFRFGRKVDRLDKTGYDRGGEE